MSELVKLIEGLGSAVDDMRKAQDRSAEELKKGNETLAKEFAEKADRANTDIDGLIKAKRELEAKMKLQQERIEILEAVSSRPGNTVQAKAKDEEQMALMKQYEYDPLISASDLDSYAMLEQVKSWYEQSCGLRFVNAVYTNHENPNDGFCDLIPQAFDEDEED
jgi:hypothetical protein